MGEVYKARDTRLNRSVAIKVLPPHFSDNAEMKARFEREAQTIAGLNHPHICVLYDVGHQDGTDYLVMEYLEGQTLAERLERGALPLDEALKLAIDIADALDKAHRQGVVHRDLKPSNVMLTRSGAKLLDFGLAKLRAADAKSAPVTVSAAPTDANALTMQGAILGTLQYMSPEQLEGKDADARTDIFAFGTTFYEMVTGKKAFEGKSQVSLMAAILEHEPQPVASLQPLSPPLLDRLIRKCLAKDPHDRWQSASDLVEGLKWIRDGAGAAPIASTSRTRWKPAIVLAIILAVAGALVSAVFFSSRPVSETPLWFSVIPTEGNFSSVPAGAISPDGNSIAFSAVNASGANTLWLRSFDSSDARELPGTAGGVGTSPFWSPDGRSIGFFADGKLQRVSIDGGTPQVLAQAPNPRGASWGIDGTIIFAPAPGGGLFKISASGGTATSLKVPDPSKQESQFEYPHFLPDGKHFLYWNLNTDPQRAGLYAGSLDSPDTKRIADIPSRAEYADGYLLYGRGTDLFARPFDLMHLETTGQERRIASGLGWMYGELENRAFSTSSTGKLAYSSSTFQQPSQLVWFERSGRRLESAGKPGEFFGFVVAPDHKKAVLESTDGTLWLLEFSTGIASPLNTDKTAFTPIWAPNGDRIAYTKLVNSLETISPSSGKKETISFSPEATAGAFLQSWSPDGRFVVWSKSSEGQSDLWIASLEGKPTAAPFLQSPSNEFRAQISPDGHWIAYVSNESGREEVIVESFPQPGQKKRISTEGGNFPAWRPDGRELYYLEPSAAQRSKLMAVRVDASSNTFSASRPELLFETPPLGNNPRRGQFAAFGAGDRFLMNVLVEDTKPRAITVILNWPALLK
jgi:eukaryotic-like serine/threonine-protein kinase